MMFMIVTSIYNNYVFMNACMCVNPSARVCIDTSIYGYMFHMYLPSTLMYINLMLICILAILF